MYKYVSILILSVMLVCMISCATSNRDIKKNKLLYNAEKWFNISLLQDNPIVKSICINYSAAFIYTMEEIDKKDIVYHLRLRDRILKEKDIVSNIPVVRQNRYIPIGTILDIVS